MNKPQFTRPEGTGGKSVLGSDNLTPLNELEKNALGNLDEDKLTELAKCLFTLVFCIFVRRCKQLFYLLEAQKSL